MRILTRYLITEFLKIFVLCLIIFLSLYLAIDFLQKIDNFLDAQVSKDVMLEYFVYKVPFVIVQMLPAASLISVIIVSCLMRKRNEITAVKACGLNISEVFKPIMVASAFISLVLFLFAETIVPFTSSRSNEIWRYQVEKQDPSSHHYGRNHVWYKGVRSIYWIWDFNRDTGTMEHPTLYFFDRSFRMTKEVYGQRGVWENGRWRFENGVIREAMDDGNYHIEKFSTLYLDLPETPETFVRSEKSPEEMSYWQLKRYSKRARMEGYDDTRYLVDTNLKISFPLIIFIMVLIGIPVSLHVEKGGTPLAVSIGICLCFGYMVILGFSRSLGYSNYLPPILSAWLANLIFFFAGTYMMMRVRK